MLEHLSNPLVLAAVLLAVGAFGRALEAVGAATESPKLVRIGRFLEAIGVDTNKAGSDK